VEITSVRNAVSIAVCRRDMVAPIHFLECFSGPAD
jgi:hypothetical protein